MSKFKGNKKEYDSIIVITLFLVGVFLATNVMKHLNDEIYNQIQINTKTKQRKETKTNKKILLGCMMYL